MIVLYIVILIYFNFNIMSIVNVFMLSIEKKKVDTIHGIKCRPILFMLVETILLYFCRYSCEWKQLFMANGNGIFIKSFITTSVYGLCVNFKLCAFIQSFFLLLESITGIRCKSVFFNFFSF